MLQAKWLRWVLGIGAWWVLFLIEWPTYAFGWWGLSSGIPFLVWHFVLIGLDYAVWVAVPSLLLPKLRLTSALVTASLGGAFSLYNSWPNPSVDPRAGLFAGILVGLFVVYRVTRKQPSAE